MIQREWEGKGGREGGRERERERERERGGGGGGGGGGQTDSEKGKRIVLKYKASEKAGYHLNPVSLAFFYRTRQTYIYM